MTSKSVEEDKDTHNERQSSKQINETKIINYKIVNDDRKGVFIDLYFKRWAAISC